MPSNQHQMLPTPDDDTRFFWQAGEDGRLKILRCNKCAFWIHPPKPNCPRCLSLDVAPQEVSGKGAVYSYSVNVHRWFPDQPVPYVLVSIELDEQPGLRVTSTIVEIAPEAVRTGQRVEVGFRQDEDVWLPYFRPAG